MGNGKLVSQVGCLEEISKNLIKKLVSSFFLLSSLSFRIDLPWEVSEPADPGWTRDNGKEGGWL